MDLYFQGRAAYNRGVSPDLLEMARGFFERALELDGGNVDALVGLGTVDMNVGSSHMTDDPAPIAAAAEASLAKALTLAPNHPLLIARWATYFAIRIALSGASRNSNGRWH